MKVQIKTKLREGIKDIEGDTILTKLGKETGITQIKVGQVFYLDVNDDVDVDQLAKNIFVNELLYDYEIC